MASEKLKVVSMMLARDVVLDCPHCGVEQSGFVMNPAGGTFDCDECEKPYKVNPEADIEHK